MRHRKSLAIALAIVVALGAATMALASGPTGAIFTTTPSGAVVNENVHYQNKIEVYLDGGPGPNAPQTAAGLDDGKYVFQVSDPSGKYLLSQDPAKCRVVEVLAGVIQWEVPATELGLPDTYSVNNKTYPCRILDGDPAAGVAGPSGRHDWNYDVDYGPLAIVVQLMPFGTTPNPGGVYKAWMTPLTQYTAKGGDLSLVPQAIKGRDAQPCPDFCATPDPGFKHPDVKTDNFKVKGKIVSPEITVKKFHDKDADGVFDPEDEWITGWHVSYTDPLGVPGELWTPWVIVAEPPGAYSFLEDTPPGTAQTASYVDAVQTNPFPQNPVPVNVAGSSGEKHEVVFGNVGLGEIKACKVYDRDADGAVDTGEPGVPGWMMQLTGSPANGTPFAPITQPTGPDGCTTFTDLLPGQYTVTEMMPLGAWFATGATSQSVTVVSTLNGATPSGGAYSVAFTNCCSGTADFGTKGYWHNKNGLDELTDADRDYVNGLPPYQSPSSYFEFGDEPFDGQFADGTPVAAVNGTMGELIAPAGSWKAEVSHFLVDSNAGGDPREQLAQQLLAFIFNVRHRLDAPGAPIFWNGAWLNSQSLIDQAIAAWLSSGTDDDQIMEQLLDGLNNSDALPFVHHNPCEVVYP